MDLSFELTAPKKKGHNSIKKREAYIAGRMNRLCGLFIRLIKEGILPSDFAQKQTENGWKWKKCFVIIVSNKKVKGQKGQKGKNNDKERTCTSCISQ